MTLSGFRNNNSIKALLLLFLAIFYAGYAQAEPNSEPENTHNTEEKFNPGELILHHVGDAHEWHYGTLGNLHLTFPLPVIIYSKDRGLELFWSSMFHGEHKIKARVHNETAENAASMGDSDSVNTDHEPGVGPAHSYNGYYLNDHGHLESVDGREFTDLSITKNAAALIASSVFTILLFLSIAGNYKKNANRAPKGLQSFFEPIILFIRDDIAKPNIGPKYERFLPYLLTIFFFIWFNNLLGLLPGGANLTGNIAVTLLLAVFTFIVTNINGNKGYWMHIINTPGVPWWLKTVLPIMPIVELIGLITKPFSLMVRLFANITAGHIIILSLLCLIFMFKSYAVGVGATIFSSAMMMLELFVAILQAYVFTLLSSMYFGSAVAEHHHEDHSHEHAH